MSKQLFIESILITVAQGETEGYAELELLQEVDLYGIIVFPQDGARLGDVGKLEVVHPQAGIVGSYSNNALISPKSDQIEIKVERNEEDPATLSAGLKIRFTYIATDGAGRDCIVWLRVRK